MLSFDVESSGTLSLGAQQHDFSDHAVALLCQGGPGSVCDSAEHGCVDGGAPGLPIDALIPGSVPADTTSWWSPTSRGALAPSAYRFRWYPEGSVVK